MSVAPGSGGPSVAAALAALVEVNEKILLKVPLEELASAISGVAARLLEVPYAGVRLVDGGDLLLVGFVAGAASIELPPRIPIAGSRTGRVVRDGEPLILDLRESAPAQMEYMTRLVTLGFVGFMGLPLQVAGRAIGVFTLLARRPFTREDLELASAFAAQAAVALEHGRLWRASVEQAESLRALALDNARLYEDAARGRREAEVVAELARSINASRDPETILRVVAEGARDLCRSELSCIALREPGAEAAVVRHTVGFQDPRAVFVMEPGRGVGGDVLGAGRPVRTEGLAGEPPAGTAVLGIAPAEGVRDALAVPITASSRVIGVLCVAQRARRTFTDHDEAVLARLADHAAVAIGNVRLYGAIEDYAERLRALDEVNRLVSSSLKTEEVLRNLAAAVARFFDAPYVTVWRVDTARGRVIRAVTHGEAELDRQMPVDVSVGEGVAGWVVEHRRPILWSEIDRDARVVGASLLLARGLRSYTAYPIALGDRVLGAFALARAEPSVDHAESAALLGSLAAHAAVALDNARLYTETTRRLEDTRALLDVSRILNSTLDTGPLLKRVAIRIAQVCRVDRCTVWRWDGTVMVPLMSQFADGNPRPELWKELQARSPSRPADVPLFTRVLQTGQAVIVEDALASPLVPKSWAEAFTVGGCVMVPLVRHEHVVGAMSLSVSDRARRFAPWQLALAQAIAGQLVLGLANTRLYEEAQDRLRETRALLAVGEVLSASGSSVEAMRGVARVLARALAADMVGVYEMDAAGEVLSPIAGYHVPAQLVDTFRSRPLVLAHMPALQEAWKNGRAAWSTDVRGDERFVAGVPEGPEGSDASYSVLLAPTLVRGAAVGAIFAVWWRSGRTFKPPEINLIEGVAGQVGLALENEGLARATQAKLRETETLLSVSRSLSGTLELQPLLRHVMARVTEAVAADAVGVWLLSADGEWLEPMGAHQLPSDLAGRRDLFRLSLADYPFYAAAVRAARPVLSTDPADGCLPREVLATRSYAGLLFVPIVAKEHVIGGFAALWRKTAPAISDADLALLEGIASQAGAAVENARLFAENSRQVQELTLLHGLSRALTGQLDRDAVMNVLGTQVPRAFAAPSLVVILDVAGQRQRLVLAGEGRGPRLEPEPYPPGRAGGLSRIVFETGEPVRTADYRAECARRGVLPVPRTLHEMWLGVPMRTGSTVAGVLAVNRPDRPFTDSEVRLLGNIGDLAALALHSAWLFEERTRAYADLAAAQEQLVRTENLRALGEMASGVAHDFNNLLAAILGRAQLLLKETTNARRRRWLEVIERSAIDGAHTVRRLQEFTRIRRDQPFVGVDLSEVAHDTLEITQSRWREEAQRHDVNIEVRTRLEPVPEVAGDPAELREALTNIILNAVDAMPGGGVLSVATELVDGEVHVTVADTGAGMSAAVRRRIFDPFFTTKGPRGTGLGLAMSYGIVSRHGGRIEVESEEGAGSVFRLVFAPGTGVARRAPPPAAIATPVSLRCLVVDDEPAVGALLGDVLESGGHRVVVCLEGAEAIARFRAEPFDLVFTDLAMPGLSGWQVARALKAVAPEVPIFIVTGFGVELSSEECQANGVEAILVKPLGIQEVLDTAARVAARAAAPPAHAQGGPDGPPARDPGAHGPRGHHHPQPS